MIRIAAPLLTLSCLLGACTEPGQAPLRQPNSAIEHTYLQCLGQDPYLLTTRCREAAARVSDDPTPGLFGR